MVTCLHQSLKVKQRTSKVFGNEGFHEFAVLDILKLFSNITKKLLNTLFLDYNYNNERDTDE